MFLPGIHATSVAPAKAKKWNFLVYIAANNNLYRFALKNINEMKKVGSNKNVNIFYQVDIFGKKESAQYKVEKGKTVKIKDLKKPPMSVSGTPESLFGFAKDIITNNPADHTAIIVWGHGSGSKEPHIWGKSLPELQNACFSMNPETGLYEIDNDLSRGIAFNEVARTYLTNQELKTVLERIKNELLGGKKIDIVGMDACSMAMTEVCTQIKSTAKYMVASQEVVPGYGWDYRKVLEPFLTKSLLPAELANQIVDEYGARYNARFSGLTKSAVDLEAYEYLENNINETSKALLSFIDDPKNKNFIQTIKKIRRDKGKTTSFVDPDYIDLSHFYKSLLGELNTYPDGTQKDNLTTLLKEGIDLTKACVTRNSTGRRVNNAMGLSIYFPRKTIHTSYLKNDFTKNTDWCLFLYKYLKGARRDSLYKENFFRAIPQEEIVEDLFSDGF